MALSEFELIKQCFAQRFKQNHPGVILGIGDDCALLNIPSQHHLATSIDTLVKGIHFPHECDAYQLGWRSLLVNLSDLAAMGAKPLGFTLALTLPEINLEWIERYSQGLADCASQYDIQLVGGDTTKGPLSISIQVMGIVPVGQAITRSGAKENDLLFVSGELGAAAAAVKPLVEQTSCPDDWFNAYYQPKAQIDLGIGLRSLATACLDISDGLLGDLQHILDASNLGAELNLDLIPVASSIASEPNKLALALSGGDDYQLCFSAPKHNQAQIMQLAQELNVTVTCIGRLHSTLGIVGLQNNESIDLIGKGYQHFSS
jgi:thiamine-monophosphate kinase